MTDLPPLYFSLLKPAACIRVSGEDAATYLQGQFSNQLERSDQRAVTYGFWLSYKGKVEADSFVLACEDGTFLLLSYYCKAPQLIEKLEHNIIADDVMLEDLTEQFVLWVLGGKESPSFFAHAAVEVPQENVFAHAKEGYLFLGKHLREPHYDWLVPKGTFDLKAELEEWGKLKAVEMDIESARVLARVPAVPRDIGPGELPQEGGFADVGVSLSKGCYLGQEVMSRLNSMGSTQRQLYSVSFERPIPLLPAELFYEGRRVGELRSAAQSEQGCIGIALLKKRVGELAPVLSLGENEASCVVVENSIR